MLDITSVGIAGTGMMGAGIAEVAAKAGFDVIVRGRSQASADNAVGKLTKSLGGQVDKGKLSAEDRDDVLSRVRTTTALADFEPCGLVVESVVEDLDVKRQLFAELDRVCGEDTILATNTSTLPVIDIAMTTMRPERVVGLHFFNPAPRMPLVEIIPTVTTTSAAVDVVRRFAEDCGKETVTAKDHAGFIVNALLFPYLNGAVRMVENDIASKEDIDAAMRGGCGFPMGPLELLDLVGLDTSLAILEALSADRGDPCNAPAPLLKRMVTAKQLGRKTGQGFFTYPSTR
ncbi:MAG: 3-hydroxyacyl-CoA dehydrogenase family protein [Acidimicrobiales bacterium]